MSGAIHRRMNRKAVKLGALLLALAAVVLAMSRPSAARTVRGPVTQNVYYAGTRDALQSMTATYDTRRTGAPWVIVIHGGSWAGGSRASMNPVVKLFSTHGFAVFNISYRVIGDVPWISQRTDVFTARNYIRSHASLFHIDPNRGAVYGFSAGGQLAATLGLDGDGTLGIRAVVTVSGVLQPQRIWDDAMYHNGTAGEKMLAGWEAVAMRCPVLPAVASCNARWQQFLPQREISAHDPAMLMFQGERDSLVPYLTAPAFAQLLTAHHVANTVVLDPALGHTQSLVIGNLARERQVLAFVTRAVALHRHA